MPAPHYDLLLKEIELLNGNIKNMDDIIHKTKNFALLLWGGSLSVLLGNLESDTVYGHLLLALTTLIPALFWGIEYRYRRHLMYMSMRDRVISKFINSAAFPTWIETGSAEPKFPLYDLGGWIYTRGAREAAGIGEEYLVDHSSVGFWQVLFYKDAKWFYSIMIFISAALALFYSP